MIRRGDIHPYGSGYQPIADYLATRAETEVLLTFDEIEALIDAALPPSARRSSNYWTAKDDAMQRTWRTQGWRAHFDIRNQCIHFVRDVDEDEE